MVWTIDHHLVLTLAFQPQNKAYLRGKMAKYPESGEKCAET
jgi:hypothetical protein